MKNILTAILLALMLLPAATLTAQTTSKKKVGTISGTIVSEGEKEPLPNAAIQLFTLPDTVFKAGNASDLEGKFSISIENGEYLMRITYVGFLSQESKVKIAAKKNTDIGEIQLKPDVVALKEATVTAEVPPCDNGRGHHGVQQCGIPCSRRLYARRASQEISRRRGRG